MKKTLLIVLLIVLVCNFSGYAQTEKEANLYTETAVILEATEIEIIETEYEMKEKFQSIKLKITSGEHEDEIFEVGHNIPDNVAYAVPVKKGDQVVIMVEELEDGTVEVAVTDYMRQNYIIYLYVLFIILIVAIGRTKGLKAVITLTLTMFSVVKILLPMILEGANPIPITICISVGITVITVFIIGGLNSKSIAAIIGTSGGVLIAGLIAYYIGNEVRLTGLSSEEANMLIYVFENAELDFKSLLFAGIIMGALGAVMDVGMSISSAMEEIHNANNELTREELFSAGMNVGKDIMGTMSNTLILAYTGSSIPLLLLFMAYETSIIKILNLDIIATEVIRSLAGSIGLVLTIPLTAFVASILMKKSKN